MDSVVAMAIRLNDFLPPGRIGKLDGFLCSGFFFYLSVGHSLVTIQYICVFGKPSLALAEA